MSKELEAFRGFKNGMITNNAICITKSYFDDKFPIIEQALQRLESIDNAVTICKKANEQKFVYIKESYGIVKEKFLDNLDYEVLNNRLYVSSRGMYYDFPLKDYGVWWALTKEELENE